MTNFLNMEVAELPNTHKLCYLGDCNFTRASVAYDYKGDEVAANTPRFKHRVPDVTVENLLTGNQSDGGDTLNPELLTLNQRTGTDTLGDTTGFTAIGTTPAVIASSTAQFHSGSKSLRVDCAGDAAGEGVETAATTISNATAYIGGAWVYAPNGATMEISLYTNAESTPVAFTGTGAWQWVDTGAITSGTTTAKILVKTKTSGQDITFYVDDLRLAKNVTTGFSSVASGVLSITGEQAYNGYRSCKVVTPGSIVGEGVRISTFSLAKVEYTVGCWVKAPLNTPLTFLLSDDGGAEASLNFTGTGNWQYLSNKFTPSYNTSFHIRVKTRTSAQAITFYLDQAMLETTPTSGTASNWAYGGSSYSSYKTEYGCLVEEAHTNLLTANQSTCGDSTGDTTGLNAYGTAGIIIISSDNYIQGSKSCKVVTTGAVQYEGVYPTERSSDASTSYTFSAKVLAPLGAQMGLYFAQSGVKSETKIFTGTGEWQDVYVTLKTSDATGTITGYVRTIVQQAITFYVDMLQITATAYPLSWTLGGTTMAAESLTAPSSVLNIDEDGYSNLLTPNQADGTDTLGNTTGFTVVKGGETITSTTDEAHQGTKSLKVVTPNLAVGEGIYTNSNTVAANITYTAGIWLKGTGTIMIRLQEYSNADTYIAQTDTAPIKLTSTWTFYSISALFGATSTKARVKIITTSQQESTFYIDELQLSATSTARTWIPGGTQVNSGTGTIEMEFVESPGYKNEANHYLFEHQNSLKNGCCIVRLGVGSLTNRMSNNAEQSSNSGSIIDTLDLWSNNTVSMSWDSTILNLFLNGVNSGIPGANPYLPEVKQTIYLGGYTNRCNTLIRNITISKIKRSDADITARAESELPVADEYCTMIYPLTKDLSAYRVVER